MDNEIKIYEDYVMAKEIGVPILDVAKKHGVSKTRVYKIVNNFKEGKHLNKCLNLSRKECLWNFRYRIEYSIIPKDRTDKTAQRLKKLIRSMNQDGFTESEIGKYLKKHRSTIIHHLK